MTPDERIDLIEVETAEQIKMLGEYIFDLQCRVAELEYKLKVERLSTVDK